MRILAKLSPALMLLALTLFPAGAYADTIVINSGSLSAAGWYGPSFSFGNPAQGFNVSNAGSGGDGGSLIRCSPCTGGQLTSINANFVGEFGLGNGPATYGGINYSRVYYTGMVSLRGPSIIIPSDYSSLITISVPFTLSGFIEGYATSMLTNPPIFSMTLDGQGIATLVLSGRFEPFLGRWLYDFQSVTYNFSPTTPTPEPATLLLLGTGLVGAAAKYRRRVRGRRRE